MIIGIPKEIKDNEKRVSLTPYGSSELVKTGNKVLIETNAGSGSGFTDQNYINSGAIICENPDEIFSESDLIVKVKEPQPDEINKIKEDQIVFTFFHFAACDELTRNVLDTGCTAIAYETVQEKDNTLPILIPMSEVAGRMSVQNGAKCLEGNMGGKGKLLGGVPGVDASTVTILGGGVVGSNAAKLAAGLGAKVYILDVNMNRLRYLDDVMPANVTTLYSNKYNLNKMVETSDLLIGAVLVPGKAAPKLVSKELVSSMQNGSVIVDVAVDQGGCVETCKPTTHNNPVFQVDNIVHYCVANMPGAVPHTSTLALTNITLPYIKKVCKNPLKELIDYNEPIKLGLNTFNGLITHEAVAESFNMNYTSPSELL